MKKTVILSMTLAIIVTMSSCGGKTRQVPFDNGDSLTARDADSTVYGICGDGTAMNTLQLVTDMGDTLTFDLTYVHDHGKLFGGLRAGDRMAVLPAADKTQAALVINQNALMGKWVMPNPLDGSDELGICIKEGGIAESIAQSVVNYKTWRLVKGQLEIVSVREGGSEEDEVNYYTLVKLGPDSLVYRDADDIFEYSRQKPHKEYGGDLKLEKSSFEEDFQM
jgi:hypothetical protein